MDNSEISRPIGSRKQSICVRKLYNFLTSEILAKFQLGYPSEGAPDTDCVGQNRRFGPISHYISKTGKDVSV